MKFKAWLSVLFLAVCMSAFSAQDVATDFVAEYVELSVLESRLAENGFTVLGKHQVNGNEKYTSVVYTSAALKKLGSEAERGFISVLRILHNAEEQQIIASNPEYYIRAFYQKKYSEGMEDPVVDALNAALGDLLPTEDYLSSKELAKYNFMIGMPHYDDFARVAKGAPEELASRLEAQAKERIVFKLDIKGDGSSLLYGVALPQGIEKFNEKLDTMGQSHLLPYMVLLEDGEANILHAKFYLALSFPRLTMGEFMKIRSVPGDIEDAFKADLKPAD